MFKKLIVIGVLVISAVAMSSTHANAQFFDGWGWFGFSEVRGVIDLSKVPNPNSKPSIVTVSGSLNFIEVLCVNPANHVVAPGNAGSVTVAAANAVGDQDITERKRGLATIEIKFGGPELAAAETNASCVNPNWTVLPGSAAPKQMSLTMRSFLCVPESNKDPEPCFSSLDGSLTVGANPDTVNLLCTIDPVARDQFGIPLHQQTIACVEVP